MPGLLDDLSNTSGHGYSNLFDTADPMQELYDRAAIDTEGQIITNSTPSLVPGARRKNIDYSWQNSGPAKFEIRSVNNIVAGPNHTFYNFIVTQVRREQQERSMIFPTFDENIILSFGQKPKFYSFSGTLIVRAGDGDWLKSFSENYANRYRLEMLVKRDEIIYLYYSNKVLSGYFLDFGTVEDEQFNGSANFSFTMYVVSEDFLPTFDSWSRQVAPATTPTGDGSAFSNIV